MTTVQSPPKIDNDLPRNPEAAGTSCVGLDGRRYEVSILTDVGPLASMVDQWNALASSTVDPNPFYEPWYFLPAFAHLRTNEQWRILVVQRSESKNSPRMEMCGFFPFIQERGRFGTSQWSLWQNQFCFLTSPLIHPHGSSDTLRAVMNSFRNHRGRPGCLEFPTMSGEGRLQHAFTEVLRENLSTTFVSDQYLRATTTCRGNVDDYLKAALGGHHVREYRRGRRKLESQGQLEYRQLHDFRSVNSWVDWFLNLEAQGWKAKAGTAIKQSNAETAFFREMVAAGVSTGKVRMEGLFLNGEPIALKCILFSFPAAFAFKIAFDESYHSCSPGVQLEMESLQRLADDDRVLYTDSCAVPGHQMIDRLWTERRLIRHMMVSTGGAFNDVFMGSWPLLRSLNRVRKRWQESWRPRS